MKAPVPITDALADPSLLGAALGRLDSWATWLSVLKAAFGHKLNRSERDLFNKVAGDRKPPAKRVSELWAVVSRRSGKSRMAAAIGVFIATLTDARSKLAKGEIGYVPIISPTERQSQLVFGYCKGFLEASELLRGEVEGVTANEIRLRGNVVIATIPASHRTTRGRTCLGVVLDECAYFRDETSATPDLEVYRSLLPSLVTTKGMLVSIGSPYRRIGLMHAKHRDHFGHDGDVLVVQGASALFNPMLDKAVIAAAERNDPEAARSEWFAEFRSDLAALFDDAAIDAAVDYARPLELPPRKGIKYFGFTDASAGRHDSFTCAIGHVEDGTFIADVVRGRAPPFNPVEVANEFSSLAKGYGCKAIVGDSFAGEWVAGAFKDGGVKYETSPMNKSALYLEAQPHFNQGRVRIPEDKFLLRELRLLERRTHRSGNDSVDHPRNGSDDLANALCGCLHVATGKGASSRYRAALAANAEGSEPYALRMFRHTGLWLGR